MTRVKVKAYDFWPCGGCRKGTVTAHRNESGSSVLLECTNCGWRGQTSMEVIEERRNLDTAVKAIALGMAV